MLRARILIVDDEPVIADTLSVIFRGVGYETFTAYNGVRGLAAARDLTPNLVLTDVMMPGMDGVSMAMEICNLLPDVRVLLFSGQAGTADLLQDAQGKGFQFELLHKPIPPTEIIHIVQTALSEPGGQCKHN